MYAELTLTNALQDKALGAYREALLAGWVGRLLARLTGQCNALKTLAARHGDQRYVGAQVVPISAIHGSENRTGDFDREFHPLSANTQSRWLSVFNALRRGLTLPPVELVRAGDEYYVRDGHHRISASRALGRDYVDAIVLEMQLRTMLK